MILKYWEIHESPQSHSEQEEDSTLQYTTRVFATNTSVLQLNYDIPKTSAFIMAEVTTISINWKDTSRSITQQDERSF